MEKKFEQLRVEQLRDYSLDEIFAAIPYELAELIDMHQQEDMRTYQTAVEPWPKDIEQTNPDAVSIMTNNTGMYDDALEGAIYEDELLLEYTAQRQADPGNQQVTNAIRARRTILARLWAPQAVSQPDLDDDVNQAS